MQPSTEEMRSILQEIGYSLAERGQEWRARPVYRSSGNDTSLKIDKNTGRWVDFSEQISGSFEKLVALSLGLDKEKTEKWLKSKGLNEIVATGKPEEPLEYPRFFDENLLDKLVKNTTYWESRGATKETVELFGGGVCQSGKMAGRYVFPIYNEDGLIQGFAGRSLYPNNAMKWKLFGRRSEWGYPLFLTRQHIEKQKSCILVESIGDGIALWDAGVKNFIISFGLNALEHIIYNVVALDPSNIVIAFNNDSVDGKTNYAGNRAAWSLKTSLSKFFASNQIKIKLPTKNDFGSMTREEIQEWAKK